MLVILPLLSLKFCRCFTEQTASPIFQCVTSDTIHFIQQHNLMRRPGSLCLIFESTHSFPHFHSGPFGSLCNCNMNFITTCLLTFLSCSSEVVGNSKRFCHVPASKHVALLENSDHSDSLLPLSSYVYLLREGLMRSVHNQLALRKDFDFLLTLPCIDCLSSWAGNL